MKSILIIDNEIGLCEIMREYFETKGYLVIYSLTGGGGLDAFEESNPDIVILEAELNDIKGFDVYEKIRAINPKTKILVTTSSPGQIEYFLEKKLAGVQFLLKPISLSRLCKIMDNL